MATIYEVATEAGVSPKTAARILAGGVKRSKNRESVLQAASKLGYVRNQQAATLRSGRSNVIGVVVPGITNPAYTRFVQVLHEAFLLEGYHIFLTSNFGRTDEQVHALNTLQTYLVDAVIINSAENEMDPASEKILETFISKTKPVIIAGNIQTSLPVDRIIIQNQDAVTKAVSYLAKTGKKRIAFLGGPKEHYAIRERYDGYRDGISQSGLTEDPALVSFGTLSMEDARNRVGDLLRDRNNLPDAIVAGNDLLAYGVIRRCAELNIRVPEDVAVVGFDDLDFSRFCTPSLSTLRQPKERIASECVQQILKRIKSNSIKDPTQLFYEPELIIRESA
ncbi:LacI family DNA-binding transcriptional regulator [Rubellicoccus peritrichatus]|uniref:LacI family DNA-binding transcriptional regulator n=1 Tax=Rubellicoccus peritrichatus TaxID=3080537 RepID=A0AAQ3LCZ3_9BACT|nr:LacI family DNA-binding transcriptional regulator [Puniceicoccus sp. CR14]WOO43430.1 LacI family DNA-binding transcriptional regulator [Puniceicoccus sp. CR14]